MVGVSFWSLSKYKQSENFNSYYILLKVEKEGGIKNLLSVEI